MSADTSNPPSFSSDNIVPRDVILWRRKKHSISVILISTATWVLLEFYKFNFVTVASWIIMFIVTSLFIYGNLVRLFGKEEPKLPGMEISDERAIETAHTLRTTIERAIQWMMHVSAEREWFVFARVVAVIWLLSYIGSFSDFLTLAYIGVVAGMSAPVIYEKQEVRINRMNDVMKTRARGCYEMMDRKLVKPVLNKVANGGTKHENLGNEEIKEKKTE